MAPPVSASIKPARSESSTPKLTTPTTPAATKEISLPTGRSNCSQTPLLDTLNKFAQSIQSSASLTTRRDLLAQQLASQDKDRQRHQRYNGAFTTLVEDTESKLYALGKSSATLEKQVENRSTAQALISSELAEKLQTTEVQVATLNLRADGSETPVNEKVTQTELAIFRTELRKVQEDIANLRRKAIVQSDPEQTVSKTDLAKSLRGYVHQEDVLRSINKDDLDHYMTKYSLDPTEHKADVARLDRKISDIQFVTQQQKQDGQNTIRDCHVPLESKLAGQITEVARLDRKIADILSVTQQRKQDAKEADIRNAKCFGDLTISISRTETKLSDIEQGTGKLKEQYAAVKKGLGHQEESLARLTTLVCGDLSSDKPGLKKLIEDGTQEIAKTQGFVESLRGSIHGLSEAHASTLTTSEQSSAQAVVRPDPSLNQDMVILREELDALKEEQKGKDECVSSDIEKLENLARQQIDKVALLQEEIRRTSVNLYKQPYHSQSLTTSTRPTQPPTPPQSRAFSPQEADRLKLHEVTVALQELKDQTNALETLSAVQQQRFDGLTSDYLVQCMVARMTHIYPNHPSSLPNQVTQIGIQVNHIAQRQSAIDHFLQNSLNPWRIEVDKKLAARPGADVQLSKILDAKVTEVTKALSDTRTCLSSLGTSLTTLQNDFDRQKASDPVSRTLEFANLYSDQIKSLIDRVNVLEAGQNTMTETFTAVMSDITTLNKYLLINSGGTSRQSRSREEVRELGAEPDAEAREPLVTVRDSKSIEIFDDLTDDSNAPSDRLKDRSNVRAQEDSSEEQPHSSRIDYSKDITPSSTRKRKRHSDSLFLENHDSVARLVSVKDQRTLEPWEYA